MRTSGVVLALWLTFLFPVVVRAESNGCIGCHIDDTMEERARIPAERFKDGVHAKAGLGCIDCHGGRNSDEFMQAHSRKNGFRGKIKSADQPEVCGNCHDDPSRMAGFGAADLATGQADRFNRSVHGSISPVEGFETPACTSCHGTHGFAAPSDESSPVHPARVPETCARCHSDLTYMRAFTSARVRVDQLIEYRTSIHGQRLAKGDEKVAVCSSCHADHLILPASDSRSSVHPLNVAETCGRCHSDPEQMKGYEISAPDGTSLPLPTDQQSRYTESVHYAAMTENGDLSAPTCNDCHGNHGATPPEVRAVATVCAQCHSRPAELFTPSEIRKDLDTAGFPECATCHGHHRIVPPGDALLAGIARGETVAGWTPLPAYRADAQGFLDGILGLKARIDAVEETVAAAENYGMDLTKARLELTRARDHLIRARVMVHAFDPAQMMAELQGTREEPGGLIYAERAQNLAELAFGERAYRRKGMGFALAIIACLMVALIMKIRRMESRKAQPG